VPETIGSPLLYAAFSALIAVLLALDLGIFHRRAHAVGLREALGWSAFWIAVSLAFNAAIYSLAGPQRAIEFLTGYLVEKALSVDNIFVFVLIFGAFGVAREHQHRVLFWGIVGALAMRAGFIFAGSALLEAFHWMVYAFGALILLTGWRVLRRSAVVIEPSRSLGFRIIRALIPMTGEMHGQAFFVRRGGKWLATPLLLILIVVETTDLIFAVDSIPAIFAVTRDPFIVYTSNTFAILGLRSMYFLLARAVPRFRHLKTGLGAILVFIGVKMLAGGVYEVGAVLSLAVIGGIITVAVTASLLAPRDGGETAVTQG
jgi:tellurite resistance protein TerC